MTDPNGYFRAGATAAGSGGPPAGQDPVVIKIQNVSARPELNGRMGIATGYQTDRGRYTIHLVPNSAAASATAVNGPALSLKPENVTLASSTERMQAQYQLLRYDPRVRQEARRLYQQMERRVAPLPLPAAAGILALLWLVSCYFFGLTLTLFWSSLVALVVMYVVPFCLQNQRSIRSVWEHAPSLVQHQLEQHIPMVRGHLNKNRTIGIMITAVVLIVASFGYYGLRSIKSMRTTPPLPWDSTTTGGTPTRMTTATTATATSSGSGSATAKWSSEEYYRLGFEDAKEGKEYGTSLPATTPSRNLDHMDPLDDLPPMMPPQMPSSPPRRSGAGSSNMLTTMLSAFFVGRTVWDMGRDPTGPMSLDNWNWQRAQVAVTLLPMWQKAILGMSVYRLVSAVMTMMT